MRRAAYLYDLLEPLMMCFRHQALARALVNALDVAPHARVVDLGCGTGWVTRAASERVPQGEVMGVDASAQMIAIATRKRESQCCRFTHALAEDLPFPDDSFDAAISSMFFHHVDMDLKRTCLAEMRRVVKPGGCVVIADLDRPWSWFGTFFGTSGYLFFRQPEIRENLQGCMPGLMSEAGLGEMETTATFLGCIRLWRGRFQNHQDTSM